MLLSRRKNVSHNSVRWKTGYNVETKLKYDEVGPMQCQRSPALAQTYLALWPVSFSQVRTGKLSPTVLHQICRVSLNYRVSKVHLNLYSSCCSASEEMAGVCDAAVLWDMHFQTRSFEVC